MDSTGYYRTLISQAESVGCVTPDTYSLGGVCSLVYEQQDLKFNIISVASV